MHVLFPWGSTINPIATTTYAFNFSQYVYAEQQRQLKTLGIPSDSITTDLTHVQPLNLLLHIVLQQIPTILRPNPFGQTP